MGMDNDVDEAAAGALRTVRRRRAVLAAAAAAALISLGGLVGSAFVQSPSQSAADTRPPRASVITAPVTSQVLRSTLVLRGSFADGKTVQVAPTSVATTANNPGGASMVVTGVFTSAGQQVRAGKPLLEYSGRPVFALPGRIPAYRDLLPGETGKDVLQLQQALAALGYPTGGDDAGVFGVGTKAAVSRLYRAMGYPVPLTGQGTADAVKAAQQQVDQARSALQDAQYPAAAPEQGASPAAGSAAPGPQPSASPDGLAALRQGLAQAEQALARAQALDGAMLPQSEAVFMPSLPARVVSVPVSVGDPVKGTVLTLSQGGLRLTGMLDPADGPLVKPGMAVQVLDETSGAQLAGTVESVGALVAPGDAAAGSPGSGDPQAPQSVNGGAAYLPLGIDPSRAWDQNLAGQDVRITITAAASAGAVLAVPEAAITAQASTETSVTVLSPAGAQRQVTVRTGISASGLVQVTALPGQSLAAGDQVVVGR
jgi:HlyD family secretion protein